MEGLRLRTIVTIVILLIAVVWVAPNVIDTYKVKWWPSKAKLNYGLDIQGGLHLVMAVDVDGVVTEHSQRTASVLKSEFTKESIPTKEITTPLPKEGEFQVELSQSSEKAKVISYMDEHYSGMLQKLKESDLNITYKYYDSYLMDFKNKVIQQAIETIRNRIDEFGVAEPSISQQGNDRIVVQLPGMADAEKAKQLINTAAKLDFMLVDDESPTQLQTLIEEAEKAGGYSLQTLKYTEYVQKLNNDLKGKIPEKTIIYFQKGENAQTMELSRIPFLLKTDTNLGGNSLDNASVTFGEYGAPEVAISFNPMGANLFKNLTGANVGKRMAVVLDKVVKTAPTIQTQIGTGRAVITLGSGRNRDKLLDEAKMISTALRAGALPASLEQVEERRVGPTLGADSIRKAQLASWVGALLVLSFILLRYKSLGLVADVSMVLNILMLFALLTSLGATLTLPGIAGIALTVGFGVDANVLINERIREELRKGSSINFAVKEGYHRAMSAILDSNITTAATAVVLLYFGTGPVRGFAVTLLVGIITTIFANVFISKVIVDTLIYKFGVKKISV